MHRRHPWQAAAQLRHDQPVGNPAPPSNRPSGCWDNPVATQKTPLETEGSFFLPAAIAGFTGSGVIKEGLAADIIVYNVEETGLQYDSPVYDTDFPGGERRIIQNAKGHSLHLSQR